MSMLKFSICRVSESCVDGLMRLSLEVAAHECAARLSNVKS